MKKAVIRSSKVSRALGGVMGIEFLGGLAAIWIVFAIVAASAHQFGTLNRGDLHHHRGDHRHVGGGDGGGPQSVATNQSSSSTEPKEEGGDGVGPKKPGGKYQIS